MIPFVFKKTPPKVTYFLLISFASVYGQVLVVEPPIHTSKRAFDGTIKKALEAGFIVVDRPRIFPNKTVVLQEG